MFQAARSLNRTRYRQAIENRVSPDSTVYQSLLAEGLGEAWAVPSPSDAAAGGGATSEACPAGAGVSGIQPQQPDKSSPAATTWTTKRAGRKRIKALTGTTITQPSI